MNNIVITNRNRDGAKIWLHNEGNNKYSIQTDKPFVLQYCRYGLDLDDSNKYIFIDPSGGPMINIGDIYEGLKVIEIGFDNEPYLICSQL